MWSLDGRKMNEGAEPIRFELNERVRVNLINNSMMNHPIHIHGLTFLVTGTDGGKIPVSARWPETTVDVPVGAVSGCVAATDSGTT